MDLIDSSEITPENPFDPEKMLLAAAERIEKYRRLDTSTGAHPASLEKIKTYSMEEAKSLEIVTTDEKNPFGELEQPFTEHLKEIQAAAEAIVEKKPELMKDALVVGQKEQEKVSVSDILRATRERKKPGDSLVD